MIVEDERDEYTQYDVSDFQQGEGSRSSHVDLTYSTDIPTNIANQMSVRRRTRDRQAHQQLKVDLVEHIWRNLDVIKTTIKLRCLFQIIIVLSNLCFMFLCFNVFILKFMFQIICLTLFLLNKIMFNNVFFRIPN